MQADLDDWIGKSVYSKDTLDLWRGLAMKAALEDDVVRIDHGAPLPPLWHWLYFLEARPRSALGRDGHPAVGGFLPPVSLPRRMWAGGRLTFLEAFQFGEHAVKRSTIQTIDAKMGRTGPLCFVTVRHDYNCAQALCIREEQDLVYREDPHPNQPKPIYKPADMGADRVRVFEPDPVLLFRYSALTFNGHRIHYDHDYARDVEGYRGLVVHGPLLATLLADMGAAFAREAVSGGQLSAFSYRGHKPVICDQPFRIMGRSDGREAKLWIADDAGDLCMSAEASWNV